MSVSRLVVVPSGEKQESAAQKIERLQAETRTLAREQLGALSALLAQVYRSAEEVCSGGDIYPAGARELARRLAEDAEKQAQALVAIIERK
ncbi:MAG: hypothetical protein ACHP84_10755 [Caulobacterales bacterium]